MNDNMKEVDFEKYCPLCEYGDQDEKFDPCNDCLDEGMRDGTSVPHCFKEKN